AKSTKGDAEVIEITSAYERKPLGAAPLAGLVEIAADRRLRIAIKPFLDADETRLQLASRDPEARRGAALKLAHQADAGAASVVEAAIAQETVPNVRPPLGLAIVFGLMGVINMAHGELMALGAYSTFVVQNVFRARWPDRFDAYFVVALPVSFAVAALVGVVLERGVIRRLYGRPLETLLLTWGAWLIL